MTGNPAHCLTALLINVLQLAWSFTDASFHDRLSLNQITVNDTYYQPCGGYYSSCFSLEYLSILIVFLNELKLRQTFLLSGYVVHTK